MSKLSFRARALDPAKQMPIFLAEELPDLPEYSAINRAVPQMPSGMEKEEEAEHHLQRAICTGLIIPTPEVFTTDKEFYDRNYPANYKMPRQLIHMQVYGIEQDAPEYDMDSSDEIWVEQQSKRLNLSPLKFEQMMDRLEKNSGQTVVTLAEAKSLLKQDDELSIAIYDYWLNKRLKLQHPLILTVKTDTRVGTSSNNPYLAFRRRTEKMQTRKNRKNDESSYEKMLRLRRDLQRALMLLEMVKEREKMKVNSLKYTIDIFEKRVEGKDYSGALLAELTAATNIQRPACLPLYSYAYTQPVSAAIPGLGKSSLTTENANMINSGSVGILTNSNNTLGLPTNSCGRIYGSGTGSQYMISNNQDGNRKEKRQYKKRKLKLPREKRAQDLNSCLANADGVSNVMTTGLACHRPTKYFHLSNSSPTRNDSNLDTEDDDLANVNKLGSESEEDSLYSFKRRPNCDYQRPCVRTEAWPWETSAEEKNHYADIKYRYTLTSLSYPRARCIGFARRRLGRGGRVIIDRASTTYDDLWSQLDYTIIESKSGRLKKDIEATNENQSNDENDELLDDNIDMRFVSELMLHRRQQRLLEERINKEQTQTIYKQSFNPLNKLENNNHHYHHSLTIKEESAQKEPSVGVCSTADDSNEPLSSFKNKSNHMGGGDEDDEENVNLAELSNLIKHSNATNQNQKSDMKAEKMPYIYTTKDLVLYEDDDILSTTLNEVEDVAREKSFLPKRRKLQDNMDSKRQALLNYTKVFSGIYNDWLHFRPHHNLSGEKSSNSIMADKDEDVTLPLAMDVVETTETETTKKNILNNIEISENLTDLYAIDEPAHKLCLDDTLDTVKPAASVSTTVGHSAFKISLPNSQYSPPTILQLSAPAQLFEEPDLAKEQQSAVDMNLVKDESSEAFQQSTNISEKKQEGEISSEVMVLPEQIKTKNILFQMHNNIATNNGKTIGKLIPALQMNEENKTKLNQLLYTTSSAYGQKIFIQKTPMSGITLTNTVDKQIPYSTAGINIIRKDSMNDDTLAQYSLVKQKKNMLSTGPLLFTTANLTRHVQVDNGTNTMQNNVAENIIVNNQVNSAIKNSAENKEIMNSQKKILFANLISSSVPRNSTNYGDENTDTKTDGCREGNKQNIIQTLQQNETGTTTIIDGTAITRYVTAPQSTEHGQKKIQMRGSKLFKMASRPFFVADTQQKIKLEEVDKDNKPPILDRRLSTSGTSSLPSNSYFLTPITSAVQLKTDNDNKASVSLHAQKIKLGIVVKEGDNKGIITALPNAQNQIVQTNSALNVVGSQGNMQSLAADKRIIYTSLLNVKALSKNNNGDANQCVEPATSNGLHVETSNEGRALKNKTILRTSLHSSPVTGTGTSTTTTTGGLYSVNNRYNVVKISGTKNDKNLNNKPQAANNNNAARSNTYAYIKPDANKNIVIVQNFNCNNLKNENNGANKRNLKKEGNEERNEHLKDNDEKYANVNGNPAAAAAANDNSVFRRGNNKTSVDNRKAYDEEISNNDNIDKKNISDIPATFPAKRKSINQKKTEHKSKTFKESTDHSNSIEQIHENNLAPSTSPKTTDSSG